ncbi:helix-turn-helix domain-containing protein [Bacillus massiliglaciei]|uniref:helix-turn-helix domain-containing protein n=1 Tax=Bacillus massiliglaciei TaxID=1816693 RepID=UPI000DA5FB8B
MDSVLFRTIRQSKGLTQRQFAEVLGVSKTLISLIEINYKPVSEKVRLKVIQEFGGGYIETCRSFLSEIRN